MLVYGTPSKIWNGTMEERKMKRSNFQILSSLIGFVGDMKWIVIMAILMGVAGFMAAILIPVLGGYGILKILANESWQPILWTMVFCAFMRGVLRYAEQASNHYIAFKLLAHIRDVIFRKLRALAPAKLETKEKGNLISLITSDVELLEVFYAHTISPVCIAFLVSLICVLWQGSLHFSLALLALIAYGTIGGLLPYFLSKSTMSAGRNYREKSAMINARMLEGVRGIQDLLQFGSADVYKEGLIDKTRGHAKEEKKIKQQMGLGLSMSNALILFFSVLMFLWSYWLYQNGFVSYEALLISPLLQISSFGPVIALSNLGTGLAPTLGAGNRLLDLLEEEAVVEEVKTGTKPSFDRLEADGVDFGYGKDLVLQDFSLKIPQGKVLGIRGASGCGKSTLLKLLMRFWDVERGKILVDGKKIQTIQTSALRDHQSCVSQETHLFHDTIEKNISFVKEGASREEIEEACRKANIHDFILSLPQGYSTLVQELGSSLSGGEKQRIGLARAFLSGAKVLFLDEPTSNLDSLNEAIILKSIDDSKHGKTIILVSHRESTLQNCDLRLEMGKA